MHKIGETLKALGLHELNSGTWSGSHGWSRDTAGALIESLNPTTGQRLAQIRGATGQDYEQVLTAAVHAAKQWRQVPAPKRGEIVRLMGEELRLHKNALGSLVSLENGKIKAEGDGEVQEMIDIADFAVGQSRMLYGNTMHSERAQHRMYEQWHPLGIVGVISAFNFPVAVWSWNAFLAAIGGNVVIWKPSPKTSLCSLAVQNICNRVLERHALPPIFQLFIDAGTELAARFVDDKRVALISFTGSTHVGRQVGMRVAERLGKSLLELGGNNAIIVDESANLDLAVPAIVFGAIGTAGQRCTSTRRVLVHRSRAAELERRLVAAYGERFAAPKNELTHVFPKPVVLANADLASLGMPRSRAATLSAVAAAAVADPHLFDAPCGLDDAVKRLRSIRGVGEWTAQYIALRQLREPDAFPAADVGLMRAMAGREGRGPSTSELLDRADAWRPWRAYAAQHLWAAA